ncbi:hypothetical protein MPSEU_000563400 [Mayamaea pseudoterrestris]|nr:hypothetical protein MPSEU_000563400 [Mayamaea pseudoterrestris]
MSAHRPTSKRSIDSSQQLSADVASANKRTRSTLIDLFAQQQIESLQAEAEYERSRRISEQQQFEKAKKRLQDQVKLAVEQAEEAQGNLQRIQQDSESIVEELKQARNNALGEVRRCQLELRKRENDDSMNDQSDAVAIWENKCNYLEQRVATFENNEIKWKAEFERLQKDFAEAMAKKTAPSPQNPPKALEEAPPAVMTELCRVRTLLAEMERKERQSQRKIDDLANRNKVLLQKREEVMAASRRAAPLEKELIEVRSKYETLKAKSTSWQQLERQIVTLLKRQNIALHHDDGLPEAATMARYMEQTQSNIDTMKKVLAGRDDERTRLKEMADSLQARVHEMQATNNQQCAEKKGLETELQASKQKVTELETKVAIYLQETGSLRALIKTFDNMPLIPDEALADEVLASPKLDTSLKTMQIRMEALQQELSATVEDRNRLDTLLHQSMKDDQDAQMELARVREKFEKLKDALYAERAKVEQAEARAAEAEALAGKGSFNPETTRVLHMKESPLTTALKEEVKMLRQQLEVTGEKGRLAKQQSLDPEKLNQRLKESFKEQITLFREGVFLMTGFKVDMIANGGQPTFRVRSMYAEHEDDHLMLRRPDGDDVKSLDLMSTDFARSWPFLKSRL